MLNQLMKSIGIPFKIRSFMVDYVDTEGRCFHKPLQTVTPPAATPETDAEVINYIRETLSQQGYKVSGILEAEGDLEMDQLEAIFNDANQFGKTVHPLFLDPTLAFGSHSV